MNETKGYSRHFVPLVDNEVHFIELSLGDRTRWNQQTHTWCGEIAAQSMLTWLIFREVKPLQDTHVTCIRDGEASSQVA